MHMIANTTADALSISDAAILKKAPSSIPICLDLVEEPTASSWTPDNTFLYISSSHKVHRYDPASNCLKDVYSHNAGRISQLVAKGNKTVIFSSEEAVYTLECDPEPTISQTYTSHKNSITSLSLSNDNTLLASTSNAAVHVHNLALGSLAAMRSLPNHNINTCIFHPHSRTRLLVGAGKQLLVYDTTRPSSPLKTVVLNDAGAADISAVACSLVDLEKEKALFRVLNLKATLTTIEFSPEGAAIYLGTDTGKIMVVDLRALDKPSKGITLSNHGSPIQTISVQKKARSSSDMAVKTPASHSTQVKKTPSENLPPPRRPASSTVPQGSKSASKMVSSPARARAGVATSPIARRSSSLKDGPGGTPIRRPREGKQVLSPVRDPLGNSASSRDLAGQLDELADRKRGKAKEVDTDAKPLSSTTRAKRSPSPRRNATISATRVSTRPLDAENPRRARTLPSSSSASVVPSRTRKSSNAGIITSVSDGEHLVNAHTATTPIGPRSSPVPRRSRTVSSASRASAVSSNTKTTKTASMTSRSSSSASRPGSSLTSATTQPSSSSAASSPTSAAVRGFDLKSFALLRGEMSRTPSPDMPTLHASGDAGMGVGDPLTPVPMSKQQQKKQSMSVLGMGTPEVNRWVQAGKEGKVDKGKGKTVGFEDDEDRLSGAGGDVEEEEQRLMKERERTLSLQISPQRPLRIASTQSTTSHAGSLPIGSLSPNMPIDLSPGHTGTAAAAAAGSAQDLLKTIVQDVMFDFQRETKAEMMGLHLDLLRMGRSWKAELRQLMEEYVGDLRDLREENQRLRVENERLRRGF
ncbi:hypothetical protein D9613_002560 [Agrocybe pediades]|uniref:WD40 repeat-like protein n=1 Tax=Agrocybe pediades TaxID=84607 RepID=A0A8H4VL72_9AGAR|nr:hypothetical protein D9613_002560 [Agrocybe pediades]